jgi:hypothetical protein
MSVMTRMKRAVLTGACFALAMVIGTADLLAQTDEEFDKIYPFIGNWDGQIGSPAEQDRGNCGGRLGDYGEKLLNCTIPVGQLPLNARAEAWLKYMDARQSPSMTDCQQIPYPAVLGEGSEIMAYPGRLEIRISSNPWFLYRTVWMNGMGPKPMPGQFFQHGISYGHFDGNDLIIVSDHFTFDPDGLDDHLHMASSTRKKITERYTMIDNDNLRVTITLEDPTFLTRPFKYAFLWTRIPRGGLQPVWVTCDPEVARAEVEYGYPGTKYQEPAEKAK